MLTVQEAVQKIKSLAKSFGDEWIPLQDAYGRVLYENVHSDREYPPFNRATMDGVSLRLQDFEKGIREFEVVESVLAGSMTKESVPSGKCIKIMTGAPVPDDLDLVIKVEDVEFRGNKAKINLDSVKPYLNIAKKGEDLLKGDLVIKSGLTLTPAEISSLAAIGKSKVKVQRLPTVAIISTGNEIKPVHVTVAPHQIRDSNSFSIEAFFRNYLIVAGFKKLVKDDQKELEEVLKEALKYDIVITSGGVSMGEADYLPEVFNKLGIEKVFHKVQVKPGKPIWVGQSSGSFVFGLPGNPLSVLVGTKVFIEPFIRKSFGLEDGVVLNLPVLSNKKKKTKFDEFFPCQIISNNFSGLKVVDFNGSGDITATLNSHGLGLHPAEMGDLNEGDLIPFLPWKTL